MGHTGCTLLILPLGVFNFFYWNSSGTLVFLLIHALIGLTKTNIAEVIVNGVLNVPSISIFNLESFGIP